jgi:uncharacterized Zn finger protein
MAWFQFRPYVNVAQRRAKARRELARLAKKGHIAAPVQIAGRSIATSFWGRAWCDHLESFSDFENRLPRGRTYVRNGSVVDLKIEPGRVTALVNGSELYQVQVTIKPLSGVLWSTVKAKCAGRFGSLIELLQGRLSGEVMQVVADRESGLFPKPKEIRMACSCPDWAGMCKHAAAVLYGVGARLDARPELLFHLRGVNHDELIDRLDDVVELAKPIGGRKTKSIASQSLGEIFGIEIDTGARSEVASSAATTIAEKRSRRSPNQIVPDEKAAPPSRRTAPKKQRSGAQRQTANKTTRQMGSRKAGRSPQKLAAAKSSSRAAAAARQTTATISSKAKRRVARKPLPARSL